MTMQTKQAHPDMTSCMTMILEIAKE